MATNNQKVVAEALHLAQTKGFTVGFDFLCKHTSSKMGNNEVKLKWFSDKCYEHHIGPYDMKLGNAFYNLKTSADSARESIETFTSLFAQEEVSS